MFFPYEIYEKHLSTIGFIVKGDNCIGLQIADISPSALLREVNETKDFYGLGRKYREKLYFYNKPYQDILGMRKIL